jgi:LPS-assembly protein
MSRHFYDTLGQETPIFYPVGYSFGVGYKDECTTLNIRYSSNLSTPAAYNLFPGGPVVQNPATRNQTLTIELVLRTLGDVKSNVGL